MINWAADSVQAVLFPLPGGQQDDALQLWGKLFPGDSPDGFQKAANSPMLQSTASGERDGQLVNVNAQVGRIDVFINPSTAQAALSSPASPPRMSNIDELVSRSGSYLRRLAATVKPFRVALVLDLATTVVSGQEAKVFGEALPMFPLPKGVSDPSFQLNVRRPFKTIPSLIMNRLCAWNIGTIGFMNAMPGIQALQPLTMTPYCGLKIDVNSAPEQQIPPDTHENVINECIEEVIVLREQQYARLLNA